MRSDSAVSCSPPAAHASTIVTSLSSEPHDFDKVYQDHFAFVWRVSQRLGVSAAHLDDVCQEVFVVVHRRLDQFEDRAKLTTWLYRIVLNVVRNHRRAGGKVAREMGEGSIDPDEVAFAGPTPEGDVSRAQAADVARDILMSMDEKHRMAFVLVELEGLSVQEAAEAIGETFHTVRSRLRAARSTFQRKVRRMHNLNLRANHE